MSNSRQAIYDAVRAARPDRRALTPHEMHALNNILDALEIPVEREGDRK